MIRLRGHHLRILYEYLVSDNRNMTDLLVMKAAIDDGKSVDLGLKIIDIMRQALDPREKIMLSDNIDFICSDCRYSESLFCSSNLPLGFSTANDDRSVLEFYGLQIKTYQAAELHEMLLKKGREL